MTLRFLETASFWLNIAVVTFTALVALSGVFALYFSSRLSAAKDAELTRFQEESKVSISLANARAAEAREGTAKAVAEAATANERSGKLELDVAKQRERTAKAEKDLLELQEQIEPRHITTNQRARLVEILRQSPKGLVNITCVLGDGEGAAFAEQVDEVLKAAGWPSEGVAHSAFVGGNPIGFIILVHSSITAPVYASTLQKAFNSVGIPLIGAEKSDLAQTSYKS